MLTNMNCGCAETLGAGPIRFRDIPVFRYSLTVDHEKQIYTTREFIRIYRDMALIREFETMLSQLAEKKSYNEISCALRGPVCLSFGEEAAAVGEAYCMGPKDVIFGSRKNHGFAIAKGLSAIEKMTENELIAIMKTHLGGDVLEPIAEAAGRNIAVRELAIDFLLYGMLCEILGKRTGFNRGMAGSAHVFFTPFGIYPNNTIGADSAGLAVGAASYRRNMKAEGFTAVNLDASDLSCGKVFEAMRAASSDDGCEKGKNGGLPLLFTVVSNENGLDDPLGNGGTIRIGAGVCATQMYAERVNGCDPMAVIDAVARKKERMEREGGPALLELVTGFGSDDGGETWVWGEDDPVRCYREKLIRAGIAKESELGAVDMNTIRRLTQVLTLAADGEISPYLDEEQQESLIFSGASVSEACRSGKPAEETPYEECPRAEKIAAKVRAGYDADGNAIPKDKRYNVKDAVFEPIAKRLFDDSALIVYGERAPGGAYEDMGNAVSPRRFPMAPVSEALAVSSAIGYAMCGGRAVVSLSYADLVARAGDEIINQLAKWRSISGGTLRLPVVLRARVGIGQGAQRSQDLSSMLAGVPGLRVIYPVTPYDMKGMMETALQSDDPVVVFESQRVYAMGECFREGGVPTENYTIPFGEADVKREGEDLTILTFGPALYRAVEAATVLEEKYGVCTEIIDARSLVPFDYETVMKSVSVTGRLVIVGDSPERASLMRDIASNIGDFCFDELDAPPVVVGAKNRVIPSHDLAADCYPSVDMILDAIHQKILPLKDYAPKTVFSTEARIRRAKLGL